MDNILIYLEVLHSLNKQKAGQGFMILKSDLEEAYG